MPSPVKWSFCPTLSRKRNTTTRRSVDKRACRVHNPHMDNQPAYISHSQFTTWLQCGEKYRLTKIVGVEEDPAWYFAGGTSVHAAADAIDHQLLKDMQ